MDFCAACIPALLKIDSLPGLTSGAAAAKPPYLNKIPRPFGKGCFACANCANRRKEIIVTDNENIKNNAGAKTGKTNAKESAGKPRMGAKRRMNAKKPAVHTENASAPQTQEAKKPARCTGSRKQEAAAQKPAAKNMQKAAPKKQPTQKKGGVPAAARQAMAQGLKKQNAPKAQDVKAVQETVKPVQPVQPARQAAPKARSAANAQRTQGRRRVMPPVVHAADKPCISQTLQLVGKKPAAMRSRASEHPSRATLRMIPLGGMCEIGKNMTAYEYGNDIIIVDCGQIFPDETMPGVDAVIPDFTYVLQNRDRVRGIFITHGHEDHIGGLPYLMREFKAPIYGGKMAVELLKYKLDDRVPGLTKSCTLRAVEAGDTVRAGCFSVEFIHVNHSIADAFMFAIKTPIGTIVHSGDFKIDYTPISGEIMDLQRIAQLGREGVLLFVCESTNIEVPGFSKSERHVGESMADMFKDAQGRIFVATFSSNTSRLQQIFTAAERHDRKVALVGRSMLNVFNAANNLGYIQMKPDTLIEISQVDKLPPEQVCIISTGSQGEPMSALTRIAFNNHRELEIQAGDTVIISATPIPGNEKPIYKVINELYKREAKVYYSALADVHVSGHASQEEIKLVHSLVRPKFFIPAHGETRMLYQHAELAHKLGVPFENIFILANGDIFEIAKGSAKVTGFTNGEAVLIDGSSKGEVDNTVLRERKLLSDDGVVSIALAVSAKTGAMMAQPVVSAMGFLYDSEHQKIEAACRQHASNMVTRCISSGKKVKEAAASGQMQGQMRSFLYEKTKRRPVVLISLIEVE